VRQGCGSGSRLDPNSDFVDPDLDSDWESGSGSRGKKTKKKCILLLRLKYINFEKCKNNLFQNKQPFLDFL
jgi:hypothetical protein